MPVQYEDSSDARNSARRAISMGRPMRGMVYVDPPGIADDAALGRWVLLGIEHARSLPPKTTAPRPVPAGAGRRARAR